MATDTATPKVPPRWFVRSAWHAHRALVRASGGRLGLWRPKPGGWGTLRLTTIGRKSGEERSVLLGYLEVGDDFVTMATNGWSSGEPAWWLNLQANPKATVETVDGTFPVRAHAAEGAERARLWQAWQEIGDHLDGLEALRGSETAVVVLAPIGG